MRASRYGHTEIAEVFIQAGAEVNAKDKSGRTALMYAAHKGHAAVAKVLLDAKADVNALDADGLSAMMRATYFDNVEVGAVLLGAGSATVGVDADFLERASVYERGSTPLVPRRPPKDPSDRERELRAQGRALRAPSLAADNSTADLSQPGSPDALKKELAELKETLEKEH